MTNIVNSLTNKSITTIFMKIRCVFMKAKSMGLTYKSKKSRSSSFNFKKELNPAQFSQIEKLNLIVLPLMEFLSSLL